MDVRRNGFVLVLACLLAGGVAACEREGPAERAGESIDEAVSEAGDELEDAKERVSEAMEDAEDEVEDGH